MTNSTTGFVSHSRSVANGLQRAILRLRRSISLVFWTLPETTPTNPSDRELRDLVESLQKKSLARAGRDERVDALEKQNSVLEEKNIVLEYAVDEAWSVLANDQLFDDRKPADPDAMRRTRAELRATLTDADYRVRPDDCNTTVFFVAKLRANAAKREAPGLTLVKKWADERRRRENAEAALADATAFIAKLKAESSASVVGARSL